MADCLPVLEPSGIACKVIVWKYLLVLCFWGDMHAMRNVHYWKSILVRQPFEWQSVHTTRVCLLGRVYLLGSSAHRSSWARSASEGSHWECKDCEGVACTVRVLQIFMLVYMGTTYACCCATPWPYHTNGFSVQGCPGTHVLPSHQSQSPSRCQRNRVQFHLHPKYGTGLVAPSLISIQSLWLWVRSLPYQSIPVQELIATTQNPPEINSHPDFESTRQISRNIKCRTGCARTVHVQQHPCKQERQHQRAPMLGTEYVRSLT